MRERHVGFNYLRSSALADEAHRIAYSTISVTQHNDLVARPETQRTQHGIAACRRILHEGDVLAIGANKCAEPLRRMTQRLGQYCPHETAGLRLHALLPFALRRKHHA